MFQHTAARRRLVEIGGCIANLRFQHTAARRRLACFPPPCQRFEEFQHTAARRRLDSGAQSCALLNIVSTHSRPKAAGGLNGRPFRFFGVSTHSRPKAAGFPFSTTCLPLTGFNTQPPEGGWFLCRQAAILGLIVSTHSRPKAAGRKLEWTTGGAKVSTHSRPKAAGLFSDGLFYLGIVSTHSRPKAAGRYWRCVFQYYCCFNTQPPEGGWIVNLFV